MCVRLCEFLISLIQDVPIKILSSFHAAYLGLGGEVEEEEGGRRREERRDLFFSKLKYRLYICFQSGHLRCYADV